MEPYVDLEARDVPEPALVEDLRQRFPTERETDALLCDALVRRTAPPFRRPALAELSACLSRMLADGVGEHVRVGEERWLTGGGSKLQMAATVRWGPDRGSHAEQVVVRLDPTESQNATSRLREFELLRAFEGVVPVPRAHWVDPEGRWFPQPTLVCAFVEGVTKPSTTSSGRIAGVGTEFGPELRARLAPHFIEHLARIHTFDHHAAPLTTIDRPQPGTTLAATWHLNRARRIWEQDRAEDLPLMEVAANWLERNVPVADHVGVVHGDYRSGNFLFDEATGQLRAWLDWERAFVGDRHRDLAWTAQPRLGHPDEDGTGYYVSGLVRPDEFFERYSEASGLSVDPERLVFYGVLNSYQMAASLLGTVHRVVKRAHSHHDAQLANLAGHVPAVLDDLVRSLREVV